MNFVRRALCITWVACAAIMGGASSASAAVYWGDNAIAAADLDGSNPNLTYFKPPFPSDSASPICGVAVSSSYLYWAGAFGIGRVNFEGQAAPQTIVSHLQGPCGIAVDGEHIYWAEPETGGIGRANLDGSAAASSFIPGASRPCGVAVDGEHVYWIDMKGIGRANLDGTAVEPEFLPLADAGCGLAVDGSHLYWGEYGAVGRAGLDGSKPEPGFISGIGVVDAIAVDGAHVYWTDRPEGMIFSSVGRANLDGSGVVRNWIGTDRFQLGGVAVDDRPAPVALPLPSQPFQFGQIVHQRRTGTVVVDVLAPARGELALVDPPLRWKVLKGTPPPEMRGDFRWRLKVWPGRSRFGRKIRAELNRRGSAKLVLRLAYAEVGQLPVEGAKAVTMVYRRVSTGFSRRRH